MSKIKKEIMVAVDKYTNSQGEEKNRFKRIGVIIDTKYGEKIKIENYPIVVGGWDGWASLFDPKPVDNKFANLPETNNDDIDF
jgi:hypothetical protein